jgi:hypothetical protein
VAIEDALLPNPLDLGFIEMLFPLPEALIEDRFPQGTKMRRGCLCAFASFWLYILLGFSD